MNISSLQTDYLNLANSVSQSSRQNERAHSVQAKCTFCGLNNHSAEKCFKRIRHEKEKAHAVGVSSNMNSERPPQKYFRCVTEDQMIAKCPKPPKDNEKRCKQVRFNEKGNRSCNSCKNDDDHKIYASMARMSSDDELKSGKYCDSLQFTNWILDSGATCHVTPEVSDFILGSLEDTENSLKLRTDITSRQNRKVQYVYKCATITEINSSQPYITYS